MQNWPRVVAIAAIGLGTARQPLVVAAEIHVPTIALITCSHADAGAGLFERAKLDVSARLAVTGITVIGLDPSIAETLAYAIAHEAGDLLRTAIRVRSTNATILDLLKEGNERSATFRALTQTIDRSNGIVYVEFGYCAFGHRDGCLLRFIEASHGDRYLRIVVTADRTRRTHEQLVALIAHELRHALEVIEHPDVDSVSTMEAMFR